MSLRALFTALLTFSVVFASPLAQPEKRATLAVYDKCTKANDIALTFDDGPYIYLRQISDAFTKAGVKATFFFNGNNYDCIYNADRISDVKYAYAAGHMIGSHTWAHADLSTLSTTQIKDAMYRVEEALSRILGIKPAFMRPPYGTYTTNVQNIAFGRGQSLALWDWDTGDADGNTTAQSEAVYRDIVNQHLSNALVLEHETEESTANTLVPYAIQLFQNAGYNLVTLATCLGVQPYAAIGVPLRQDSSWTCDGTPEPGDACGGSIPCSTGTPAFSTSSSSSTTTTSTTSTTTTTTTTSQPTGTASAIHPNGNSAKCLAAASNTNGAVVEIEDCSGASSQSWTVSGSLIQIYGNKCLDVTGGTAADGTKLQIWTCTSGDTYQQWSVTAGTIQWKGTSFCMDDTGGSLTNGNQVQIWTCNGGYNNNQKWTVGGSGSTTTTTTSTTTTSSSPQATHGIHPGASSTKTCLAASSNANNAAVVIKPCDGSASQTWTQVGSTLTIYGNKCLDVTNGSTANGNKMQIYTCNTGNVNQQFSVTSDQRIAWTNHGECLDLTQGSLTNGNQVQMWKCEDGNANQVWIIN